MIASKDYMTSVVMGKDVVPRLGLHQMETLRHELIATVRQSKENKVKYLFLSICLFAKSIHLGAMKLLLLITKTKIGYFFYVLKI